MKTTYTYGFIPRYGYVPIEVVERNSEANNQKSTNIYDVLQKMVNKSYTASKTRSRIDNFISSLCSE